MKEHPGPVVIGMDPHKRSVTIEVMTRRRDRASAVAGSAPTSTGFAAMLTYVQALAGADVGGRGLQRDRPARREPAHRCG